MEYIIRLLAHWNTIVFLLAFEETRAKWRVGGSPKGNSTLAYIRIGAGEMKRLAIKAHENPVLWALFFRPQTYDVWQTRIEWAPKQAQRFLGELTRLGIHYDVEHTSYTYRVNGKIRNAKEIEKIAIEEAAGEWTGEQFERFGAGYTPDGIDSHGRYLEVKSSNNGILYDGKLSDR